MGCDFPNTKCSDFVLLGPSLFLNVTILCIFKSEVWKLQINQNGRMQPSIQALAGVDLGNIMKARNSELNVR